MSHKGFEFSTTNMTMYNIIFFPSQIENSLYSNATISRLNAVFTAWHTGTQLIYAHTGIVKKKKNKIYTGKPPLTDTSKYWRQYFSDWECLVVIALHVQLKILLSWLFVWIHPKRRIGYKRGLQTMYNVQ